MSSHRLSATFAGLGSILFWSTTVLVCRILTESLGPMTGAAAVHLLAGTVSCAWLVARRSARAKVRHLPLRYLFGCGGMYLLYILCLYGAIGLAAGRKQVLEVGVINYLWPGLTLVLSVPLLGKHARPWLLLGVVVAFAGAVLVAWPEDRLSVSAFAANVRANAWPYLLALVGAFLWALYSVLTRRWAGRTDGGGVPLFILATGLATGAVALISGEQAKWTPTVIWAVILAAVFPCLLGYFFWDFAMRRGHVTIVASAGYAAPLLSTAIGSVGLNESPPATLWVACGLIIVGAVISKLSISERKRRR